MENDIVTITFMILTFMSVAFIMFIAICEDDIKHWH